MKHMLLLLLLVIPGNVFAQTASNASPHDTAAHLAQVLPPVTITAYGYRRELVSTPAAVNIIDKPQLDRYNNTSPLQAINATPGVRMEERSPGSYRLNIRGSTLRAPFGVRNVKIYYNEIPLTDPSGFSYFNQLGFVNLQSLQVIKGPGSSLYGAGTGGVMLVNSMPADTQSGVSILYERGSFGLNNMAAEAKISEENGKHAIRYQHLNSDGYRVHSAMNRDVVSWDGIIGYNPNASLTAHILYNELEYRTPGGLTLAEYNADPRSARPAAGSFPGAVASKARIAQKNILGGLTHAYYFNSSFQNSTTFYGSYTELVNPTIRNFTHTWEPHAGGRTIFRYQTPANERMTGLQLLAGGEFQSGSVYAKTYSNVNGEPDTLQSHDKVDNHQFTAFTQATWQWKKWITEGGISINKYGTTINRFVAPALQQSRDYDMQLMPRIALSYNFVKHNFVYINVARGFSPPTSAELLPTGSNININLQPEDGWNYEFGAKGRIARNVFYDASVFYFRLSNAIVLRKNAGGGDEYINGGGTDQKGIEGSISYRVPTSQGKYLWLPQVWISYTGYNFRYRHFTQVTGDFSNNRLPGVAPHTFSAGMDIATKPGISMNITYFYSDKLALNDANSVYSNAYHVLDAKLNYYKSYRSFSGKIFVGANNLLDQKYSLGNDINAAGGRYYNEAPGLNFYTGILLSYLK